MSEQIGIELGQHATVGLPIEYQIALAIFSGLVTLGGLGYLGYRHIESTMSDAEFLHGMREHALRQNGL